MPEQPSSLTDWLEAVGTVGSLFVALSILMLDRRNRKREHAKGVHYWIEVTDRKCAKIRNLGAAPIGSARVYMRPWTIPEQIWFSILHPVSTFRRARRGELVRPRNVPAWSWPFEREGEPLPPHYVEPGEFQTSPIPTGASAPGQRIHVIFKDAASNYWAIDFEGHRIRGEYFGYRREMRLFQKFASMDLARRKGVHVRDLNRVLNGERGSQETST